MTAPEPRNRFARHPRRWVSAIIVVAAIGALAVTEVILAARGDAHVFEMGRSTPVPERHIRLREWKPNTVLVAAPPAIRRANPGGGA